MMKMIGIAGITEDDRFQHGQKEKMIYYMMVIMHFIVNQIKLKQIFIQMMMMMMIVKRKKKKKRKRKKRKKRMIKKWMEWIQNWNCNHQYVYVVMDIWKQKLIVKVNGILQKQILKVQRMNKYIFQQNYDVIYVNLRLNNGIPILRVNLGKK